MRIDSMGLAVPPRIETTAEISPKLGRSAAWVVRRTGVRQRRVWEGDVAVLAARAAAEALGDGPAPDLILNASGLPRQLLPDGSVFVQRELGLDGIPCHTVHASCLSFLVALHTAAAFVAGGSYRRVLVVSADLGTRGRNWAEPESAALLGDGAAAVVVVPASPGSESGLCDWRMQTWPEGAELTEVRGAGTLRHPNDPRTRPEDNLFHMNGPAVYRLAIRHVVPFLSDLLRDAGLTPDDVDLVVPHQASGPGLALLSRLGFAADRVVNVVEEYGNCVAASVPLALAVAFASGRLQRGQRVLLCGTGAGLSAAGAILRF